MNVWIGTLESKSNEYNMTHVATSQHSTAKRSVCNNSDSKLSSSFQESDLLILNIKREGGILNLKCRDWVDGVSSSKCIDRAFRQPEIFHLSRSNTRVKASPIDEQRENLLDKACHSSNGKLRIGSSL